ncbi:MAG: Uma2 family endonuclease [Leptolyngbya sp. SIO3F4]|nr:Uma2 family endonuclease [Leptolyngbya sp. SIO3F4]
MVPQEPPYASTTSIFGNDFVILFAGKAWVRQQLPITIPPSSEPEPDIAVVRLNSNRYRDRHPTTEDVYLLVEVSDSTLKFDCEQKSKIYAQANIYEYWVIDVKQKQLVVFREPQNGSYQTQYALNSSDTISPKSFPEVTLRLSTLFV